MVIVALASAGCGSTHGADDASQPLDLDARDAHVAPMIDTPPMTVALTNHETCVYRDYGSTCTVTCDLAPEIPIALGIDWSGPYCCNWMPDSRREGFSDCRCIDGVVLCPANPWLGSTLSLPSSLCEFCPGTPSGMIPGARSLDAGPDAFASDAGPASP